MSILKACVFCAFLMTCGVSSFAQGKVPINEPDQNKPHLFADLPDHMPIRVSNLETLFNLEIGAPVNVTLSGDFHIIGSVISKSPEKDLNVKSIVIKSINRKGAIFTYTKTVKEDGTVKYLGRIISTRNSDAYEIVKEEDQYILKKKNLYDIISE
jgi:uncharacterized protein (UPF0371 family)